jgi:hypothetical protein
MAFPDGYYVKPRTVTDFDFKVGARVWDPAAERAGWLVNKPRSESYLLPLVVWDGDREASPVNGKNLSDTLRILLPLPGH